MPNFYGPQRFGRDGETARLGLELLHGRRGGGRNPFLRKLALSAAQSVLFTIISAAGSLMDCCEPCRLAT